MARHFLKNGGFELGDRDWNKGAGWSISQNAGQARSGAWRASFNGAVAASLDAAAPAIVRPGSELTFSAWFDGSTATAGTASTRISWRDKDDIEISESQSVGLASGSGYVQETVTAIAPDRAKTAVLRVYVDNPNGSEWYVDDCGASGDAIETVPSSAIIRSHRLIHADTVGAFNPLIGSTKFTDFNAGMSDQWSGVYTFVPELGGNLDDLVAFVSRLGKTEAFLAYDPDKVAPRNGVVNDMLVDGAVPQGSTLIPIRAAPVNSVPLAARDYVEIRGQYFQVQRDFETGPEGTGDLHVWPAVRSALIDKEDVITDGPGMVARITSDLDLRRLEARPYEISISWEEV